jgi:hypothetical protein
MLGAFTLSIASLVPVPRALPVAFPATSAAPPRATLGDTVRQLPAIAPKTNARRTPAPVKTPVRFSDPSIRELLRGGTGSIVNPMRLLLRVADSLHLSGAQADSIATLNRAYAVALDPLWRPVIQFYATHPVGEDISEEELNDATHASLALLETLALQARAVLTDEQRHLVPPDVASLLDPEHLARLRANAGLHPDVVVPIYPGGSARGSGGLRRPEGLRGRIGG